jgi:hypothetical protein
MSLGDDAPALEHTSDSSDDSDSDDDSSSDESFDEEDVSARLGVPLLSDRLSSHTEQLLTVSPARSCR